MAVIRRADRADGPALAELRWDSSDESEREDRDLFVARFLKFWEGALAGGRWAVWIAERDGTIISNIWVYLVPKVPRPYEQADAYGYMTNVYTIPGERSRGVGSEMLARIIDWAREKRLEALFVSPSDESVAFYERAGFSWSKQWLEIEFDE